ncbi:MAG: tail fiber domain-containing protein, partial [Deltaproteobacteria bacterium]|nr:tail fiber domain-containing protein [Deltaproteobacteria bacterium]
GVTAANSGGNVYAYGGPGTGSAASNGNVILAHNGTSSVGNVGIGTTAPTKTLDVSSANFINLGLYRSATGAAYGSGIDFDLNNASNARKTFAEIYGAITTNTAGAEDGYLALSTATAGALTEKVRVTKDGNVGIGITSPAYRLDVAGNSRFISASESIYSSDNSLSEYLYIQPVSGSPGYVRLGAYSAVYGSQSLALQPSAGNVGIGSTAPKQKLDVNGSAQITGDLGVGTAAPTQKLDVNGNINVASDARIYMGTTSLAAPGLNSTGQRIQLYGSSGTVTGSDYSLGIENGHMWFNSGGGFKWYSQTGFDMVLDNTGKLGIGTSAPATALEVNGVVKSKAGGFQFPDGTIITTAPGTGTVTNQVSSADINFAADTANSGNPNYNISFSTRGAQRMVVANSGGIGIGTASPASTLDVRGGVAVGDYAGVNSAPFNTLIVSGGLGVGTSAPTSFVHTNDNLSKTTNHTGILFNVANTSSTPSVRKVGLDLQSTGVWNGVSSVNTGLNVNASGGSVNYAAVFSGGNVGIGTSMPGSTLQVNGSVAVGYSAATTASSSGLAVAGNIGIGTTSPRATIESVGPIATSGPVGGFILYNRGSSAISSQWYSPSLGETRLYDHPSSSDRLTISSSGNFGIGTTAPAARLDVSGSRSGTPSLVGAFIGSAPTTFTDTTTVASGTAANHAFNAIAAPTLASTYAAVTTTNSYSLYLAGAPKKGTNDTITNAVALGIGSTFLGGGTNSYGLVVDAQTGATNNFAAVFKSGNVGIGTTAPGYLLQVAGSVAGVGSYVALSDRREKKDVRDLSDSLEKALAIRGVSYKWRDEIRYGSERHLGVIAQELEKIVPEAVNTGDDGLKRVKYDDLIPLMIEAFKEERRQKDAEINRLRARSQQMTDFLCKKFDDASFCRMPEL